MYITLNLKTFSSKFSKIASELSSFISANLAATTINRIVRSTQWHNFFSRKPVFSLDSAKTKSEISDYLKQLTSNNLQPIVKKFGVMLNFQGGWFSEIAIVMEDVISFFFFFFYKLQWLKICHLDSSMVKNCYGIDVTAFAKLSHVCTYMYSDRWQCVVGSYKFGGRFLCRGQVL